MSLISLFLHLQNPSISFPDYKRLCKEYDAQDFVKVTERMYVSSYFLKEDIVKKVRIDVGGGIDKDQEKDGLDKMEGDRSKHRESDRDRGRSSHKDSRHSSSRVSKSKRGREDSIGGSAKKKDRKEDASTPITHHQLLEDLNIVVDKRAGAPNAKKQAIDGVSDAVVKDDEKGDKDVEEKTTVKGNGNSDKDVAPTEEPPSLLSQEEEERRAIQACLSAEGYSQLSNDILEQDRLEVEKITSFEIPVGDSGSILRCGAMSSSVPQTNGRKSGTTDSHSQRNFKHVLDLFEESRKAEQKHKHGSKQKSRDSSKAKLQEKVKPSGPPVIIVPNAMTSPITLINSQLFFGKAKFMPREKCSRTGKASVTVTRRVSNRIGGESITYEIMDNPKKYLKTPSDWARVVAVVAQGESWQFKGWKMGWTSNKQGFENPVEVLSRSFGFYVGFEGAPIPQELSGWNVQKGYLSRDKRGLDGVVFAQFWNGLDEWMNVHKRELLFK